MSIEILLLVAGGVLFYRVGEHDYGSGFVTAGLSVICGLVVLLVLGWGRFGYVAGQVLLFGGLTWYNLWRHVKASRRS